MPLITHDMPLITRDSTTGSRGQWIDRTDDLPIETQIEDLRAWANDEGPVLKRGV